MSVTLMQMDAFGEYFTSIGQTPEERAFLQWVWDLESAARGTTIFVHRLSDAGYALCNIPAPYAVLVENDLCPPRFCGCLTCVDGRLLSCEFRAVSISETAREASYAYARMPEEEDDYDI